MSSTQAAEQRVSDWTLMERVVARDEAALATLYDRYAGLLCSVLTRILRDQAEAEEILQDVFHQLWRNATRFDRARGSLAGWLVVSARNRAISRLRRSNPGEREELSENTAALPFDLESQLTQQRMMGRVRSAMTSLPAEQREALELAYFEGMTHSEIATHTGDPLGTVKTRLRSAVESLRRKLQP